jgi:exodeoxyribonuclease VII large subunit
MDERQVWKVSDVNQAVREILENSLTPFWVQGEVGTLNIHGSGHVYMTLKDRKSQIKAVFFGGGAQARGMKLQQGMEIEVFGKLTVYEVRGEYQFSIRAIRPLGVGDLQRRFEELKAKLESEGLFALERKRPIPALPRRIGVVTSADGAAIRDFLQIINRRFPDVNIKIYPVPVQGEGAGDKVARGVDFFSRHRNVDVIVVTRGGGSMEDLWPFNSERLARTVAASEIPVISAVGHEIDYTICDFAADLRAPTPSAAAELVIGRQEEYLQRLERLDKRMRAALKYYSERLWRRLESVSSSYVFKEPAYMLRQKQQQVDELSSKLNVTLKHQLELKRRRMEQSSMRLSAIKPGRLIADRSRRREELALQLKNLSVRDIEKRRARLEQLQARLETLNPFSVLKRGYALLTDHESGSIIHSASVKAGLAVDARVSDGIIEMEVKTSLNNAKK